jgi:hypothetical protein
MPARAAAQYPVVTLVRAVTAPSPAATSVTGGSEPGLIGSPKKEKNQIHGRKEIAQGRQQAVGAFGDGSG